MRYAYSCPKCGTDNFDDIMIIKPLSKTRRKRIVAYCKKCKARFYGDNF